MTVEEFIKIGRELWWDGKGWQRGAAADLGVSTQTISNWVNKRTTLPSWVVLFIEKKTRKVLTS